jgi:hypothetical protein
VVGSAKIDGNTFNVDDANNRVGIGTSIPTAKHHIVQTAAEDAFRVDDNLIGDSSPFIIKSNGYVGIGLTAPTSKLDVNGIINVANEINSTPTGNANMIPVAYGVVTTTSTAASLSNSTGNVSVHFISNGMYGINIDGIAVNSSNALILLTPINYARIMQGIPNSGGYDFVVESIARTTGNNATVNFYFIIYAF